MLIERVKFFDWEPKEKSQCRAQNLSESDDDIVSNKFALGSVDSSENFDEFDSDEESSLDIMPTLILHHDPHRDNNKDCNSNLDV